MDDERKDFDLQDNETDDTGRSIFVDPEPEETRDFVIIEATEMDPQEKDVPVRKKGIFKKVLTMLLVVTMIGGSTYTVGYYMGKISIEDAYIESRVNDIISRDSRAEIYHAVMTYMEENEPFVTEYNQGFSDIYDVITDSVVGITSRKTYYDWFNVQRTTGGAGSGVVIEETSDLFYIVTNYHVVQGATEVVAEFGDGMAVEASLIGYDSDSDIAVLSVNKQSISSELRASVKPIIIGDSDALRVGEPAIALGNPLGYNNTLTAGYISAVERNIRRDNNVKFIQTDAAINPGNSGGALVNRKGELIGINTAKIADETVEGIGFAIPSNTMMPIVRELIDSGFVGRPYIGISGINISEENSELYELPVGVMITEVFANTPAERAGLKPEDIIIGLGNAKIFKMEDLTGIIAKMKPGDTIELKIIRNGTEKLSVNVVLGNRN